MAHGSLRRGQRRGAASATGGNMAKPASLFRADSVDSLVDQLRAPCRTKSMRWRFRSARLRVDGKQPLVAVLSG